MRTTILEIDFRLGGRTPFGTLPEHIEASKQAFVSLELLIAFGKLLSALPEDRGNEIWSEDEAGQRLESLTSSLNALGKLAAALADHAYGRVHELTSLHEKALEQLETRRASRAAKPSGPAKANG
jgi:hypothetical protein